MVTPAGPLDDYMGSGIGDRITVRVQSEVMGSVECLHTISFNSLSRALGVIRITANFRLASVLGHLSVHDELTENGPDLSLCYDNTDHLKDKSWKLIYCSLTCRLQ